ncbi:MAG TPA: hypothetical protein PK295_02230 [Candidatus Magasanikbacteria bacterium]|nr:hypothetical protein [Candidatus Magasanikbacteria bacterium]
MSSHKKFAAENSLADRAKKALAVLLQKGGIKKQTRALLTEGPTQYETEYNKRRVPRSFRRLHGLNSEI